MEQSQSQSQSQTKVWPSFSLDVGIFYLVLSRIPYLCGINLSESAEGFYVVHCEVGGWLVLNTGQGRY